MTSPTYQTHLKPTVLLAALSVAITMTGCLTSNSKNSTTTAPVQQRMTNLGEVFTDNAGMTLYTFNKDQANISNCNNDCATKWPPLLANNSSEAKGRFSIITRADNSKQWALDKMPLYRWFKDSAPGDTTGEAVKSVWYVAQVPPVSKWNADVSSSGTTNKTTVLTDTNHKTLYTFSNDLNLSNGSNCNNGCAVKWPPLLAKSGDKASGHYTLVMRDSGEQQWAYRGMPLYRWINDAESGDTTGEGIKSVWFVAQPLPISKYNTTNLGTVLTNTSGSSLYVLDNESTANIICKSGCLTAWPPLLADSNDINRGDYTIFTNSAGNKQWSYKDQPLYHWKNDTQAGDTKGQGLAHPSGGTWVMAKP